MSLVGEYLAESLRERLASIEERRLLQVVRDGRIVCWDDQDEPLVTIRIATFNRGPLVAERAIASALAQTYERLEILVVGDNCDPETEKAVLSVTDPRLRFINLPARGIYPTDPRKRWMVAGAAPMNAALALARGDWIAPCDDDDELTPDHVAVLLDTARHQKLEMVYSKARMEVRPGQWKVVGKRRLRHGHITHGSVLYSTGLRFLRHNDTSWKLREPGDWNLWKRMQRIGVRIGFLNKVTYIHYLESHTR